MNAQISVTTRATNNKVGMITTIDDMQVHII